MFFATCSVAGVGERIHFLDVLSGRGCVRWTGDPQRSAESSPPNRCAQALLGGMQPGTPSRQVTRCINGQGVFAVPVRHGYQA
jgi:hypothetical protein